VKPNTQLASWAATASLALLLVSCGPKDADIEKNLREKANSSQYLSGKSFAVNKGAVTITGECPDEACRSGAETEAKAVKGVKSVVNNITIAAPMMQAPTTNMDPSMATADDNTLMSGLRDATKDFPTVQYNVNQGVVTLTGTIKRSDLPTIMQRVNAMQPKKVENKLTIN
jgi:osmotically-inducible protein OsmY